MARPGFASMTVAGMLGALLATGCSGGPPQGDADAATTRYLEVGVFLDNAFFRAHGLNSEAEAATIMNVVEMYFQDSSELSRNRVVLVLVGIHTFVGTRDPWEGPTPMDDGVDAEALLLRFSAYASENSPFPFDAAILLTERAFAGSKLGASSWGEVCSDSNAYAVAHVTGSNLPLTAATVARELGRTLGMCLDPPGVRGAECPDLSSGLVCANRIMSSSFDPTAPPDRFSACSALDFASFVARLHADENCLGHPVPVSLGTGSVR